MTAATLTAVSALTPVEITLGEMRRSQGEDATRGFVPGLILPDAPPGWAPASALISGEGLDDLLDAAGKRWGGPPHTSAALAWKSYTYWLALPAVLGWASARRVPMLHPDDVLLRATGHQPFLTLGLRRARVAVLPTDPIATPARPGVTVVSSEAELLGMLRTTLRDQHLDPLLAQIQSRVRLGERTLLGSLASGVAYAVIRGVPRGAGNVADTANTLLSALDVANLVELEPGPEGYVVQRRTCCLAFTLPEPKICSGCCIRAA